MEENGEVLGGKVVYLWNKLEDRILLKKSNFKLLNSTLTQCYPKKSNSEILLYQTEGGQLKAQLFGNSEQLKPMVKTTEQNIKK